MEDTYQDEYKSLPNSDLPQPNNNIQQTTDPELGVLGEEEFNRVESLGRMFNTEYYAGTNDIRGVYFHVLRFNNAVYYNTYYAILLLLSATLGYLLAFLMGILTALLEFLNLFLIRPLMKSVRIIADLLRMIVYMVAKIIAPVCELIFPGTYRNFRVPILMAAPPIPHTHVV